MRRKSWKKVYSVLTENGFDVLGFIDSDEGRWGKNFLDSRIYTFNEVKTLGYDAIFIPSILQGRQSLSKGPY